jgi:hypothetical protein
MKPTNKLRFVQRYVSAPEHGEGIAKMVTVLQQWYVYDLVYPTEQGEWKDVPLVTLEEL